MEKIAALIQEVLRWAGLNVSNYQAEVMAMIAIFLGTVAFGIVMVMVDERLRRKKKRENYSKISDSLTSEALKALDKRLTKIEDVFDLFEKDMKHLRKRIEGAEEELIATNRRVVDQGPPAPATAITYEHIKKILEEMTYTQGEELRKIFERKAVDAPCEEVGHQWQVIGGLISCGNQACIKCNRCRKDAYMEMTDEQWQEMTSRSKPYDIDV